MKNLKVHFAGAEQIVFALCIGSAGVRYMLFSVFPFISEQFGLKGYSTTSKKLMPVVSQELEKICKNVIMDSGLFTLMFGAHAGKRDRKFMDRWCRALIEYVQVKNYKGVVVEIVSQKVLGVKSAWDYRKRLKKELPDNQIVNVFHIEDGQQGLDRMIEYSDYIALSIPELRLLKKKEYAYRLAHYIKNKKPNIDIHLLGCTELKLLDRLSFCTSSDSTSWQQINRYGTMKANGKMLHIRDIKPDVLIGRYGQRVKTALGISGIAVNQKRLIYYSAYCLAAENLKQQYAELAGSQD
jgi:hypothetical protein